MNLFQVAIFNFCVQLETHADGLELGICSSGPLLIGAAVLLTSS